MKSCIMKLFTLLQCHIGTSGEHLAKLCVLCQSLYPLHYLSLPRDLETVSAIQGQSLGEDPARTGVEFSRKEPAMQPCWGPRLSCCSGAQATAGGWVDILGASREL